MSFFAKVKDFLTSVQFNTALVAVAALVAPHYTDAVSNGLADTIATVALIYNSISAYVNRAKAKFDAPESPSAE